MHSLRHCIFLWLSCFVVETCLADGNQYPATIYPLLVGLLQYRCQQLRQCPNFLDKGDTYFSQLRGIYNIYTRARIFYDFDSLVKSLDKMLYCVCK